MAHALKDLLEAITKGTSIDVTFVGVPEGANSLASSDAYLLLMQGLLQFRRTEEMADHVCLVLHDVDRHDQVEALRTWLDVAIEPIDVALAQLEREREHSDAETIEKEMAVIADALKPICAHTREAIRQIIERQRKVLASLDLCDLLIPVPNSEGAPV